MPHYRVDNVPLSAIRRFPRQVAERFQPAKTIVRTPKNLQWRLANGDIFHTEIVTTGKVLYEAGDTRMRASPRT